MAEDEGDASVDDEYDDDTEELDPEESDPEDSGEGIDFGFAGIGDLLSQLTSATSRLEEAAEEARSMVLQGSAAGVVISLSGELKALSVKVDPSLVDPEDIGLLEDAVLAALRDALGQYRELQSEIAEEVPGANLDFSGMLGSLGGMLGNLGVPEHMPGGFKLSGGLGSIFSGLLGPDGRGPEGDDEFFDMDDDDDFDQEDDVTSDDTAPTRRVIDVEDQEG